MRLHLAPVLLVISACALPFAARAQEAAAKPCPRTVVADVVALDVSYQINRLGTARPGGLIFALRHDVESLSGSGELTPGNVQLKSYKRPRPMVLRVNEGDCLDIHFQNSSRRIRSIRSSRPRATSPFMRRG